MGVHEMTMLHKMRLLEDQGNKFGGTELGALHTMGARAKAVCRGGLQHACEGLLLHTRTHLTLE